MCEYDDQYINGIHWIPLKISKKMGINGRSRISQGAPTPEGVRQPIILQIFCRKLHENERIWTEGGARPWHPRTRHWEFSVVSGCSLYTYLTKLFNITVNDFGTKNSARNNQMPSVFDAAVTVLTVKYAFPYFSEHF